MSYDYDSQLDLENDALREEQEAQEMAENELDEAIKADKERYQEWLETETMIADQSNKV
jgi:hypothetical protein